MNDLHATTAAETGPWVAGAGDQEDDGDDVRTTCLNAQILWDADNAKMFCDLCRRTLRLCVEDQPCPLIPAAGRILLVSSRRGLTSTQHSTAPLLGFAGSTRRKAAPSQQLLRAPGR